MRLFLFEFDPENNDFHLKPGFAKSFVVFDDKGTVLAKSLPIGPIPSVTLKCQDGTALFATHELEEPTQKHLSALPWVDTPAEHGALSAALSKETTSYFLGLEERLNAQPEHGAWSTAEVSPETWHKLVKTIEHKISDAHRLKWQKRFALAVALLIAGIFLWPVL